MNGNATITHTPGPWAARQKRGDTGSWWVTAAPPRVGHRGYVAECVARQAANEANARLIAAAPDLLDVARRLNIHADVNTTTLFDDEEIVIRTTGHALRALRDAIAKAVQP